MSLTDSSFALVHQIFVLDAYLEEPLECDSRESITRGFIGEFLGALGLEPLGPLGVYPAVDQRAPGWSFIQPITTSHISAHYFEKPGRSPHIRIDAYSCDEVDWQELIRVCHRHFRLRDWRGTFIDREINRNIPRPILDLAGHGDTVTSNHTLNQASASITSSAVA